MFALKRMLRGAVVVARWNFARHGYGGVGGGVGGSGEGGGDGGAATSAGLAAGRQRRQLRWLSNATTRVCAVRKVGLRHMRKVDFETVKNRVEVITHVI